MLREPYAPTPPHAAGRDREWAAANLCWSCHLEVPSW